MPSATETLERFSSSDAERDAVDVEHDVRPLGVARPRDGDLLGDGEMVLLRVLPVDQPDRLGSRPHPALTFTP